MVESFIKYLEFEKRVSAHTVTAYQTDLHQFATFLTETYHEEPSTADFGMIRSWLVTLTEADLDSRSINRKIASLRSYYKYLLREGMIKKDPMTKVRVMKTKKKLPVFVKESEIEAVLKPDANSDKTPFAHVRDKLVVELLYVTGIRLSELVNLKTSDIDLRNNQLKVLGKRNKERIVPFPKTSVQLIKEYLSTRRKDIVTPKHDFFIVTEKGEQCYPMLIQKIVKRALQHTAADKKSPHVLRHTYATHLLNNGAEINAVKDLLGHSSLAATQVYTHNSMEKLKKVFDQAHPKA